jgi:transcriptional regulator with XRE-family HTH domain
MLEPASHHPRVVSDCGKANRFLLTSDSNYPTLDPSNMQERTQETAMTFGQRVRDLRKAKNLTLRDLAAKVKVNFTYLSKIENHKLDFGDYPGEGLIRKLAKVLGADEDELMLLAEKVPDSIRKRVIQQPDAFRKIARLNAETLDKLLEELSDDE